MAENNFVQIQRELLRHPSFVSAPPSYRCVLLTIIDHACYAPCKQDDHGVLIQLQPGQFMCTIRGLAELANVGKKDVEHALVKFISGRILGQHVGHRKSIYTILWGVNYKKLGQEMGQKVGQVRDIKEDNKEDIYKLPPPPSPKTQGSGSTELSKKEEEEEASFDVRVFQLIETARKFTLPFSDAAIFAICKQTSLGAVALALQIYQKRSKNAKELHSPDRWLELEAIKQEEFIKQKEEYKKL